MKSDILWLQSKNARSSLLSCKPLKLTKISVAAIIVFKIGCLIYYKTVKCNKWRPQKVSRVQSIFIASISNKKCWNPVFWLVVKIFFLNNLILRNTFFKNERYFSFPAAIHFLYTIIRACDLREKSSRRESFRRTSYWKIVFSTIFSGRFSEISKDHLWMAASVIKICNFLWKMLIAVWLDEKCESLVGFISSLQWPI